MAKLIIALLALSIVLARAQLECPDTLDYCPRYSNLRTGVASLEVACSQTQINVTVTNSGGKRVYGGLLEYTCTPSSNAVCTGIVEGTLPIKNYGIQTSLQPGTQCVVFGCYHIMPSTVLYRFVEARCNVPAVQSLSPMKMSNSVATLVSHFSTTTGVGLTPTTTVVTLVSHFSTTTGVGLTPTTTGNPTFGTNANVISTASANLTPISSINLTPSIKPHLTTTISTSLVPTTSAILALNSTPNTSVTLTLNSTPSTSATLTLNSTPSTSATLTLNSTPSTNATLTLNSTPSTSATLTTPTGSMTLAKDGQRATSIVTSSARVTWTKENLISINIPDLVSAVETNMNFVSTRVDAHISSVNTMTSVHNAISADKSDSINVETPAVTSLSSVTVMVIVGTITTILTVLGSVLLLVIIIRKIREKKATQYNALKARLSQLSFTADLGRAKNTQPVHQGSAQLPKGPQEAFAEKVPLDVFAAKNGTASEISLHCPEENTPSSQRSRCLEKTQCHISEELGDPFDTYASSFKSDPSNSAPTSENVQEVLRERVRLDSTFSDTAFTDSELSCEADLASNTSEVASVSSHMM